MLLPDKHIPTHASVLGVGAFILNQLNNSVSDLDSLLLAFSKLPYRKGQDLGSLTSELLLALSFLYAIGGVTTDDAGRLLRCA